MDPSLLVAELFFTAVAAGVVGFFLVRRGRTVTEGREYAVIEALALVNQTLPHLRRGLDARTAGKTAEVIHEFLRPAAVGIVGGRRILAHVGAGADHHTANTEPATRVSREVLRTGRPMVARNPATIACPRAGCPLRAAVGAPLVVSRQVRGCIVVYFDDSQPLSASKAKLVSALAQLVSLQMALGELDHKSELLAKAELAALQAQISPHFIYNTLNTIASFVRTQPDTARQLLTDFAVFLRRSFRQQRGEFAPFADELEYVHQYLSFEKARFGDRLTVVYRVAPEVLSAVVPVLVLQPLVENAVRHGIGRKVGAGTVKIVAEDRDAECWIAVEDDGAGIAPEMLQRIERGARDDGLGVGLANVRERLRSVYGAEHGLEIRSRPGEGTRVSFSVPKYKVDVAVVREGAARA